MPTRPALTATTHSISVIVPAYNVEEWLSLCLASVVGQSIGDWECVVVIDGSPDDSERIAREWAARDARISVVSVPNGGLGSARNVGLSHATGKWVCFLDSDDEIPVRALELLRDAGEADGADVVIGAGVDFGADLAEKRYWTQRGALYRARHRGLVVTSAPALLHDHVAWAKLYRRDFIDEHELRFSTGVHCEDLVFSARAMASATSVSIIPEVVYRHRRHGSAISSDYLRDKTLADWMAESATAIKVLQSSAGAAVVDDYLENFIRQQWWTRMENFDRISTREMVARFEGFSAHLVANLGSDVRGGLKPLLVSSLDFASSGGLSRRWWREAGSLNPFRREHESWIDTVTAAMEAVDTLDVDDPIEARLAGALLMERASIPLMRHGIRDETTRDLTKRITGVARLLPTECFVEQKVAQATEGSPVGSSPDGFARALVNREPLVATATHVAVTARTLTLRGVLRTPLEHPRLERMWIVFRSQNSARVRAFPIWWSSSDDEAFARWSAIVDLGDDMFDQQWKCWVRVQRGALPPRDIVLGNGLDDSVWSLASTSVDAMPPVVVVFARSAVMIWAAQRHAAGTGDPRSVAPRAALAPVFTFPNWKDNPYLTMLQLEARMRGRSMVGSTDPHDLIAELTDPHSPRVVHIHWTSPITEKAKDQADADRRVTAVVSAVRNAVARGKVVIWTVHNVLPHDAAFPDAARRLHRDLADSVSSIHTLSVQTSSVVSNEFLIPPHRETVISHSSYHGVYGSRVASCEARAALGASAEKTSLLFFGQIRPYKGLENLLAAVNHLADDGHAQGMQLLVAGKPSPQARELLSSMEHAPMAVTAALRHIEDDEIANWFSAADVLIAPYRDILNSGTVHLAATFGVPVVLPGLDHLRQQFAGEPWVEFFEITDAPLSIAKVVASRFFEDDATRAAALAFARRKTPHRMALEYADYLDSLTNSLS